MKKYFITSKKNSLYVQLKKHSPHYVLYRDKLNLNYDKEAKEIFDICAKFQDIKFFIHQKIKLAKDLGATGVHLTSKQFDEIKIAKNLGLEVIISTHTKEEVLKAQKLGANAVTYSPIFVSPEKGEPKGIDDLKNLLNESTIKVFALGGVVDTLHVELLDKTDVYGFASIRYFY